MVRARASVAGRGARVGRRYVAVRWSGRVSRRLVAEGNRSAVAPANELRLTCRIHLAVRNGQRRREARPAGGAARIPRKETTFTPRRCSRCRTRMAGARHRRSHRRRRWHPFASKRRACTPGREQLRASSPTDNGDVDARRARRSAIAPSARLMREIATVRQLRLTALCRRH